ncbi:hypothetical protein [Rhizobium sp. R339]|nr:hypothetical protein [Rhizobium sp. R339]
MTVTGYITLFFGVFVVASFGACILMLVGKGCSGIPGRARATTRRRAGRR